MAEFVQLGICKVDITPSRPVPLAGFAARSGLGPYTEVSKPLLARIFVIEGGANLAVLVSADLIWWGSDRVPAMKQAIRERCGIDPGAVILHGTHTHSGPQTSALFTSYLGAHDPGYLAELESKVLAGISRALAAMEPVRIERGTGTSALAINRRGLRVTPPEMRTTDRELNVIRFVREDGSPKGMLVHYACHPVITSENKVSPDYVGIAMEAVEEQYEHEVVCGFLQGACGDLNPGDGAAVIRGTHKRVVETGLSFAADVNKVLASSFTRLPECSVQWRTATVMLPLASIPDKKTLEQGVSMPGVQGEWHRMQLGNRERLSQDIPLELTLLRLADGVSLLAMNAEVVVEYGLYVKRLSAGRVLPIGYSNGMFGYIPTAAMLAEGGYEADESTRYFAMPSVFAPEVEQVVKDGLGCLLPLP